MNVVMDDNGLIERVITDFGHLWVNVEKTPSLAIPPLPIQPSTSVASSHQLPHSAHVIIVLPQLSSHASTIGVERYRLSTNDQPDYRVICAPVIEYRPAQSNMRNRHPVTLHLDQYRATLASTSTAFTLSKITSTFLQFLPFSNKRDIRI